jgi:hypothetical protein
MPKKYSDRNMTAGTVPEKNDAEEAFFFPKANPPVTIRAKSRKDAEEKLSTLDTNN